MPPAAIIAALVGGGIASGIAGGRSKKVKQRQTTTPLWGEDFAPLKGDLLGTIRARLADPMAGAAPYKHAINRRFAAVPGRVATGLARRGMLKSGQLGANLKGVEFARQDALADLEGSIDQSTLDLAMRLLGMGRGTESFGETQYPGNKLGGAISGGLFGLTGSLASGLFGARGGGGGGGSSTYV